MNDFNKRIASLSPEKRALLERHLLKKASLSIQKQEICRRGTPGPCQLSFGQERLWLYNQLEPDNPNLIPSVLRLRGSLNLCALEKTLDAIVVRHEILRTTFSSDTGEPLQVIHPSRSIQLAFIDLLTCPEADRQTEVQRLIDAEKQRPFDLTKDLMLRATLIRLSEREHTLMLTMHHIASDGWSMGIFFNELLALYGAYAAGDPSPLPDLSIQYADFARWQRKWMEGEVLERQLSYWQNQLSEIPPVLDLPSDRPRPAVRSLRGASQGIILPEKLIARLKSICKQEGATMFTLMMAAFKTLLYRYSGQGDICVGTFTANRNRVEIEDLIGFFVNTLVLRTCLSDGLSFRELLQREHGAALGAFANQDIPFEKLILILKPKRDLSYTPLFQVALSFEAMPKDYLELPNLSFEILPPHPLVSLYDLSLIVEEYSEKIKIIFTYRTDIFEASTIERWAHNFKTLLESIAANPEEHIETLPLLTEAEKKQVIVEWNNTGADYPRDKCIHELFEEQVERTPDAAAVVFEDQILTYRELNTRANQLAHYLRKQGVGPEVLVGICVERSLEMIIGILGILKAGGAYVPLDPTYPKERLAFMIEDATMPIMLTQSWLLDGIPKHRGHSICLDTQWEEIAQHSYDAPFSDTTSANLAYVIYTSGSTGVPKGVMIPHRAIVNHMQWMQSVFPLNGADCVLQKTPFSFDASVWEFYAPLFVGGRLAVAKPNGHQDIAYMVESISRYQVTILQLVPTLFRMLLETPEFKTCYSLRRVFCGGEVLTRELIIRFFQTLNAELHNLYGPTEVTIDSVYFSIPRDYSGEIIPIGRPVANTQAYVLDCYRQPVPIGVLGELYLGGVQMARGYLNRPELTSEKFIPNSFSDEPGALFYRTGDLARYLPDGNIEFLGRIDHQVKVRGFRIELGEIESALGQHPAVRETAVIAREEQRDNKRLVAYVVFDQNAAILTTELRSFLKEKLPDYMIPSAFVALDSLPLTPSGKVDRMALPAPDSERPGAENSYVSPRTPIEKVLAGIWCEIFGLNRVGVHDNFFELGGHSLLATQVMSRLRKVFEVEIPLRTLFESPTVEELAFALLQREGERKTVEHRAALLLKVADLSEDEVNAMLAERIRERHNKTNE